MNESQNVLWVSAHPEPSSLNGALRRDGVDLLRRAGSTVTESDLYAMQWDPVLAPASTEGRFDATADQRTAYLHGTLPDDVRREQRKLEEADVVVLQFPLWWYGMPAIMKGWLDRVFVSGFAFGKDESGRRLRFEQGPFAGKRALVVTTLGDRPGAIGPRGKSGELTQMLFGLLHGTLAYTGMSVLPPLAMPSANFVDEESYADLREQLASRLRSLNDTEPIPYRPQFQGDYTDEWELAPHVRPGETGLSIHVA